MIDPVNTQSPEYHSQVNSGEPSKALSPAPRLPPLQTKKLKYHFNSFCIYPPTHPRCPALPSTSEPSHCLTLTVVKIRTQSRHSCVHKLDVLYCTAQRPVRSKRQMFMCMIYVILAFLTGRISDTVTLLCRQMHLLFGSRKMLVRGRDYEGSREGG